MAALDARRQMADSSGERTIAAISSPAGAGQRGVIRISGAGAQALLLGVLETEPDREFPARRCLFRGEIRDGVGILPALILWMPGPRSFTREDVVELHLPGSAALLSRALEQLFALGAAAAQPGEFTRRAFENGRIDLTQAEGVLELVAAANESERRSAIALLSGGLAQRLAPLRDLLEELRALCEASLDFDAEDTGSVPESELLALFERADAGLVEALGWEQARAGATGLVRIVLVGAPNAGKSSLFNELSAEGSALVTELGGTTRDVLISAWTVCGVKCELADAPGLEPAARGPDLRAQELARDRRSAADLLLWVVDATRRDFDQIAAEARNFESGAPVLMAWNQVDRASAAETPPRDLRERAARWCATSARDGTGLDELEALAAELLRFSGDAGSESDAGTRELSLRHRADLERARASLADARRALHDARPLDWVAETLRAATAALDGISGATTAEDVLDRIFARFCLGK